MKKYIKTFWKGMQRLRKLLMQLPFPPRCPIVTTHLGWAHVGRGYLGSYITWQVWDDKTFTSHFKLEEALRAWGIRKLRGDFTPFPTELPQPIGRAKFVLRGSQLLVEVELLDDYPLHSS